MFPKRIDTSDLPKKEWVPLVIRPHLRTPQRGYVSMLPKEPIPPRGFVGIGEKS